MSGLFRNYDKFINAAVFAAPNKYILRGDRWRFNSANLYFNPVLKYTGLPQAHGYNAFSLASISQALIYEAKQFDALESTESVKQEISQNHNLAIQCAREAYQMIQGKVWQKEVETSVALVYSISNLNELRDLNKEPLLSHIIENAKYLSTQNIVDLVVSLQGYQNPQFWNNLFKVAESKDFQWSFQPIDYFGWHTNHYEQYDGAQKRCISHTQALLSQLKGGQTNSIRKLLNDVFLYAVTSVYLPYIKGESRIQYLFDERVPDRDAFKTALKKIQSYGVQVDGLLKKA